MRRLHHLYVFVLLAIAAAAGQDVTQEAKTNIDWSIANYTSADLVNCPLEYNVEPHCLHEGGRACLMQRAIDSAKANNCSYAYRLTMITQCHNQHARETITQLGEQGVCAYLKGKNNLVLDELKQQFELQLKAIKELKGAKAGKANK